MGFQVKPEGTGSGLQKAPGQKMQGGPEPLWGTSRVGFQHPEFSLWPKAVSSGLLLVTLEAWQRSRKGEAASPQPLSLVVF